MADIGTAPAGLPDSVLQELRRIVGDGAVVTEPGRLLSYETDALARHTCTPRAVVLPGSSAEAADVVRVLTAAGISITPRGAGTGLSGGSVASPGGVLLGTSRMTRILELDPVRRLARVEAGVINTDLSAAARPHGLHYPPDPSSQTACTLGGNVGENAGGPHCLKYGVTTRYVTGVTLVTGTGEVLELGGADRVGGLDLVGLVVGSEGRLGLVTEVEVRLLPVARHVKTMLGVFDSTHQAGEAVSAIIGAGLLPAAMEIMDRATIEAVEASVFAAGYPRGAGAVLVVEFDGSVDTLDGDSALAADLCRRTGAMEVRVARDEAERQALWQGRKKAYGAFGRITPDLMVQDATVPRSVLPRVLEEIEEVGRRHELRLANVFHAGDGNLHPKILYDRRDPELVERVEAASSEIMRICVDAGGTITGEHGVGLDKRAYMSLVHGPAELALMRRVQRAFDPEGRWNPGKMLPEGDGDRGYGTDGSHDLAGVVNALSDNDVRCAGETAPALDHRPADLTVRVAGTQTLAQLQRDLAKGGQWLPLDGPGAATTTVEDLILSGWAGPLTPALGGIRDHLLGLDVVSAAGESLRLGGQVMKNVAGLDLVRGVTGSGGGLCRVRAATFRLAPLPALSRTLRWQIPDLELTRLLEVVATSPILPAALGVVFAGGEGEVVVRLLGSEASVSAESAELIGAVGAVVSADPRARDVRPENGLFVGEDELGKATRRAWEMTEGGALVSLVLSSGFASEVKLAREVAGWAGACLWMPLWGQALAPASGTPLPAELAGVGRRESPGVAQLRLRLAAAFGEKLGS